MHRFPFTLDTATPLVSLNFFQRLFGVGAVISGLSPKETVSEELSHLPVVT